VRYLGDLDQERTVNMLDPSQVMAAVRRPFAKVLAAVAAVALLAGCGGGGGATASAPAPASSPGSGSGSSIAIRDFKFSPATLTVRHGASIDVTNDDSAPHSVTADDGDSFDSGTLQQGESATIKVARAGRYAYHCTVHPFMKGELVVE
jgi:plastocyanin